MQALTLSTKPLNASSTGTSNSRQEEEEALSPVEILRQVSIAHKLGEMAETYGFGEDEEEKWLTWSVVRLLKVVQDSEPMPTSSLSGDGEEAGDVQVVLADLDLPKWVTPTNLGAPLEALGAFYSRQGKVE